MEKLYTEQDMKRCFNAARMIVTEVDHGDSTDLPSIIEYEKYSNFLDYKKKVLNNEKES